LYQGIGFSHAANSQASTVWRPWAQLRQNSEDHFIAPTARLEGVR